MRMYEKNIVDDEYGEPVSESFGEANGLELGLSDYIDEGWDRENFVTVVTLGVIGDGFAEDVDRFRDASQRIREARFNGESWGEVIYVDFKVGCVILEEDEREAA